MPKYGEENHSPDDTTIPSEAKDPYTFTSEEPGGDNADLPGLMTCPNPSSKTPLPHPHDTNLNEASVVGPPNGKECTITTEILQISQQEVLARPSPKPPDTKPAHWRPC